MEVANSLSSLDWIEAFVPFEPLENDQAPRSRKNHSCTVKRPCRLLLSLAVFGFIFGIMGICKSTEISLC